MSEESNKQHEIAAGENENEVPEDPDSSFDQDQQHMFGNENAPAPDATRPMVGTQVDPILPGTPLPGGKKGDD